MAYEWEYGDEQPYDDWSWDAGATDQRPTTDGGGMDWIKSVLASLSGAAGTIAPLVRGGTALVSGATGANAANDAVRLQSNALNRGIDLQTAQWLQQQQNQAPWLKAGQEALPQLQQRAAAGAPAPFQPARGVDPNDYRSTLATLQPSWTPQRMQHYTPSQVPQANEYTYQGPQMPLAKDYRWSPQQGPRAADYRYTPGQTPDAAAYRYTPGAVPTLQGAELLANDPGVQFRLDEGRKALEASALAKGMGMSGATMAALQRQGQELSSQEYGNAWNRAAQQAQMREGWAQQAGAQNFGQAMSAAQLREQVQQAATQQGWSQAQAEAVFREQMAQQASAQGLSQDLAAQAQAWQQGQTGRQFDWGRAMQEAQQREQGGQFAWDANFKAQQDAQRQQQMLDETIYNRTQAQNQLLYGRDVAANQTAYDRSLQAYNSQNAQQTTDWNRWAALAGVGQTATQQLAQGGQNATDTISVLLSRLGLAQGEGAAASGLLRQRGLSGALNEVPSVLQSLNR